MERTFLKVIAPPHPSIYKGQFKSIQEALSELIDNSIQVIFKTKLKLIYLS
jgi:hypothetical protein